VRITGLRDAATLNAYAAGMFARHHTAIAHQLSWIAEPRQRAYLGYDTNGNDLAYTSQCLQRLYDVLDLSGCRDNRIVNVLSKLRC
jgi:hypothetical protein